MTQALFSHLEPYAGDPILGLFEAFQKDSRADKVNLSIGIYFDEAGRIPVLECVREAEARLLAHPQPKSYLPIEGSAAMLHLVQGLLFGPQHAVLREGRVASLQTIGSSGGLKVAADFLHRWLPQSEVWVSDPTWDNHRAMFEGAGLKVHTYPYYDSQSGGLRFGAMCDTLRSLPPRSVVLLHACCHNPTGVDLSAAQWQELIALLRERELLPFLDIAYGEGIVEDALALRRMADAGLSFMVSNSFSKSMSVYGERAGALSVVCGSREEAALVLGQMKLTVRRNYSNPGLHAAGIVATVLGDSKLRAQWEADVGAMRERILGMRHALHGALSTLKPDLDFSYLLTQRGMFSYTGLSAAQVDTLREKHAVYLVRSGRLCVAGLNQANVQRSAQAIAAVL
jgi:aromatic-amino-acid transaminase